MPVNTMSLHQALQTDQYFSSTWDDTAKQAGKIVKAAEIPDKLLPRINASVRITLMEWHNNYWLHEFLLKVTQSVDDQGYALVTEENLVNFIRSADDVMEGRLKMSAAFPYPSWWNELKRRRTYDRDDRALLYMTREKFYDIVSEIPHVDFVYTFTV